MGENSAPVVEKVKALLGDAEPDTLLEVREYINQQLDGEDSEPAELADDPTPNDDVAAEMPEETSAPEAEPAPAE